MPSVASRMRMRSTTDRLECMRSYRAANINIQCGNYAAASKQADEVVTFATQKGVGFWKAFGMLYQGIGLALTGNAMDAVQKIISAINVYRSMGSTVNLPEYLWYLAKAHAQLRQMDDAWRCVDEAKTIMRASGETWFEAELHRVSGEIALMARNPDVAKAEAYFQRALSVARQQQAKSWELRAAMSIARLWLDQGKRERGPRSSRTGLRLVHRRLRHARSERGEGAARRVGVIIYRMPGDFRCWPIVAPDVCDGTSAVGESRQRIQAHPLVNRLNFA